METKLAQQPTTQPATSQPATSQPVDPVLPNNTQPTTAELPSWWDHILPSRTIQFNPNWTPEQAKSVVNRQAIADVGKLLTGAALSAAGVRALIGYLGNTQRAIARKKSRDKYQHALTHDIGFPSKEASFTDDVGQGIHSLSNWASSLLNRPAIQSRIDTIKEIAKQPSEFLSDAWKGTPALLSEITDNLKPNIDAAAEQAKGVGSQIKEFFAPNYNTPPTRPGESAFTDMTTSFWPKDRPPLPSAALGAAIIGTPLALYLGWKGVGHFLRNKRLQDEKRERMRAEREFEEALAAERKTKFACELEKVAQAYVNGDLDDDLNTELVKKAFLDNLYYTGNTAKHALYALLTIAAGFGAAKGWQMGNDKNENVEAYKELLRRKQLVRPPSVVAHKHLSDLPEVDDSADTAEDVGNISLGLPEKKAGFGSGFLGGLAGGVAGAGALGLGAYKYLSGTQGGQKRIFDMIKKPMTQGIVNFSQNPEAMKQVYSLFAPQLQKMFVEKHPILSSFVSFA